MLWPWCRDGISPMDALGREAVGKLFLLSKTAAVQCLWSVGWQVTDLDHNRLVFWECFLAVRMVKLKPLYSPFCCPHSPCQKLTTDGRC